MLHKKRSINNGHETEISLLQFLSVEDAMFELRLKTRQDSKWNWVFNLVVWRLLDGIVKRYSE